MAAPDEVLARTADGVALRIARLRATGPRRGAVVCLHAMLADARYFGVHREGSFAHALAAAGFDVLAADFRGHGRSVPPRAGADDWSFDDLVELDLPAIVGAAAGASGRAPEELVLIGHSLGGLVATAALGTGRIPSPRALVLPATSVWLHGPHGPLARRALMALCRGVGAVLGRVPARTLGAGTSDEAGTFIAQLTGWPRAGRWTSLRGVDYLAGLAVIAAPVLPLACDGDWLCTPHDAIGFARRIPTAAPVRIVGRWYGDALDPGHFELFTRPALRPVWNELIEKLR